MLPDKTIVGRNVKMMNKNPVKKIIELNIPSSWDFVTLPDYEVDILYNVPPVYSFLLSHLQPQFLPIHYMSCHHPAVLGNWRNFFMSFLYGCS